MKRDEMRDERDVRCVVIFEVCEKSDNFSSVGS